MPDSVKSINPSFVIAATALLLGLYVSSGYSYLLFHSLIEFTTITIAFTLLILTWHSRRFLTTGFLKAVGIGYGLIAIIDLLHTLAYRGMGVFPGYGANLATQLWIAARYLQALLLLVAPLYTRRNINERLFFAISLAAVSALTALVFSGNFPDCFIEGKGLTPFKIASEYVISGFLLLAPGIDGLEATRRIRASGADGAVPIIAITSFAMYGDRDKVMEAGCTAYFEKPIDPLAIVENIQAAIGVKGE